MELFLLAAVCNLLGRFFDTYDLKGSLILFFSLGFILILFNFTSLSGTESILTTPVKKLKSFQHFELYIKQLSTILINSRTLPLTLDIDRETELMVRGYIGEHARLCPCPHECPLEIAVRADPSMAHAIDRTQHIYKSIPLLVGHIERVYEFYIER